MIQSAIKETCGRSWYVARQKQLKHFVKTVSPWPDQVILEEKRTPKYLTVRSRDKASPLSKLNGRGEEVLLDGTCLWQVHNQQSISKGDRGPHSAPLGQSLYCKNYPITRPSAYFSYLLWQGVRELVCRENRKAYRTAPRRTPTFLYR